MLKHYIVSAFRNIFKNKLFSLINIFGLSIGIATSFIIYLWVEDEQSFDKFHKNAKNIYRVVISDAGASTPKPLAEMREEIVNIAKIHIPEIEKITRLKDIDKVIIDIHGTKFKEENIALVDSIFFRLFSFKFIQGDANHAMDEPNNAVISKELADKFFNNCDALGKTILLDSIPLKISGIIQIQGSSHINYKIFCSTRLLKQLKIFHPWGFFVYAQTKEKVNIKAVSEKLTKLASENIDVIKYFKMKIGLQPLTQIHFDTQFASEIAKVEDKSKVYSFAIISLLILLLVCFNYVNLSISKNFKSIKEIAVRKTFGSQKRQILYQFFTEALVNLFIALFFALALIELALPYFNMFADKSIQLNWLDIKKILGLILIIFITIIITAIYPSYHLSRYSPLTIFKKQSFVKAPKSIIRKLLVIVQFTISIVLISILMINFKQLGFMQHKNIGFDKENILYFNSSEGIMKNFSSIKEELLRYTGILKISLQSSSPFDSDQDFAFWEGKPKEENILMNIYGVDYDYFSLFNYKLIDGRNFSLDMPTDQKEAYIINKEALHSMKLKNPIGKRFSVLGGKGKIIGIVDNTHFKSMRYKIEPQVFFIYKKEFLNRMYKRGVIYVKYKQELSENVISKIQSIWNKYNPKEPFEYFFLDKTIEQQYKNEKQTFTIYSFFTLLALIISCLGLYGIASFITNQRIKETGIRKVNGASMFEIFKLLLKDFSFWILISWIIASPIAYFSMQKWLESYANKTTIDWWLFFVSGFIVFIISIISIFYKLFQISIKNPVESLRYE